MGFLEIARPKCIGLVVTDQTGEVASNVLFADEKFSGTLEVNATEEIKTTKQVSPKIEFLSSEYIETKAGIPGKMIVFQNDLNNLRMLQTIYVLDFGEKFLEVTYTSILVESEENILAVKEVLNSI